jgi:hypothetical protein
MAAIIERGSGRYRGTGINFTVHLISFVIIILRIEKAARNFIIHLLLCAERVFLAQIVGTSGEFPVMASIAPPSH